MNTDQPLIDDDVINALLKVTDGDQKRARAGYDQPLQVFCGATPRQLAATDRKRDLLAYLAALVAGPAG